MALESVVQDSVDRAQDAVRSIDTEVQKIQKQLQGRRKKIEKELGQRRRSIEKQLGAQRKTLEKRTDQLVKEFRKQPLVKRAESWVDEATKQLETGLESVLGTLQIASRRDLQKIDRKLTQINRKLKDIEKANDTSYAN